ncbi:MAG: hypothetical protein AAF170_07960 [Bacteroidota bacterium]
MTPGRLRTFAREWLGPTLAGLAGAAVLIAGAEIGGAIGWAILGLAALGLIGVVVWALRSVYRDYPFDDWDDEDE